MSFPLIDNMIYRLVTAALNIQLYVDDQSGYTVQQDFSDVWRGGKTQWLKSKVTSWLAVFGFPLVKHQLGRHCILNSHSCCKINPFSHTAYHENILKTCPDTEKYFPHDMDL